VCIGTGIVDLLDSVERMFVVSFIYYPEGKGMLLHVVVNFDDEKEKMAIKIIRAMQCRKKIIDQ
jgi:hypothetical protein